MAMDSGAKTSSVETRAYRDRNSETADFIERVRLNQQKLKGELRPHYDFIVCGSGSSGSVVARRLAENSDVSVLLLEAGGGDDVPSVTESHRWIENFGTERDWSLVSQPNPNLKGRSFPVNMGKLLGGGSSINVMVWARGHKTDWDYFASESGDPAWNYESVLEIYRSEEHTSELQSPDHLVCRLLLEKKKKENIEISQPQS